MLNVYIPSVEFLKIKKYIHTSFNFVALILDNMYIYVQMDLPTCVVGLLRPICDMIASVREIEE